jgi:hypothetical protein
VVGEWALADPVAGASDVGRSDVPGEPGEPGEGEELGRAGGRLAAEEGTGVGLSDGPGGVVGRSVPLPRDDWDRVGTGRFVTEPSGSAVGPAAAVFAGPVTTGSGTPPNRLRTTAANAAVAVIAVAPSSARTTSGRRRD